MYVAYYLLASYVHSGSNGFNDIKSMLQPLATSPMIGSCITHVWFVLNSEIQGPWDYDDRAEWEAENM